MNRFKLWLKRAARPLIIIFSVIFAGAAVFSTYLAVVNLAAVKITLDSTVKFQTMEGFGMSAAWTFQDIGTDDAAAERLAEMLYGGEGMKLDTLRYNVGAGTKELENGYSDGATRATESFFVSENYTSPESFSDPANYDFARDKAALNTFDKCLATGNIRTVVLFANSPHYLLTANGRGNGTKTYQNNLPEENYAAFSDYLIIIADFFREKLSGLENPPRIYISPVNEPQWAWGGEGATQEGCHFEPAPLAKFYNVFYNKLAEYNKEHGADIKPDFFESGDYRLSAFGKTKFKKYIDEFKKYPFFSELEHISVHSYNTDNGRGTRNSFASYAKGNLKGLPVHMSEYCIMRGRLDFGIGTGIETAGVMMKDLTLLSATQWCWWLGAATCGEQGDWWYEDGLVYYRKKDGAFDFFTTKRYYTLSQFTRFISAGDTRIKAETNDKHGLDGMEICAFEKADGRIVAVVINHRGRNRSLSLPSGYMLTGVTVTDGDRDLESLPVENFKIPKKSVVTLEFKKT